MSLRSLHRATALLIAAFVAVHLANHLCALAGVDAHLAFMATARRLYRHRYVEPPLLAACALQLCTGATLVARGWRARRGLVPWLQAGSGMYLVLFVLVHVAAVLYGRLVLGLDTNFYYAAAGMHAPPWAAFFAPYYFLAVVALCTHVGCALHWHAPPGLRTAVLSLSVATGVISGAAIVLALAGAWYPLRIPMRYQATYGGISSYNVSPAGSNAHGGRSRTKIATRGTNRAGSSSVPA